jgi:hypothetical protein
MRQLARRASLVAVLLLASVGTASAECAWVVWTKLMEKTEATARTGLLSVSWTVGEATKSPQECERLAKEAREGSALHRPPSAERRIIQYVCLPDTVDPRGPKAK